MDSPRGAHRELERLEEELVSEKVDRELLIAKAVDAVGRST